MIEKHYRRLERMYLSSPTNTIYKPRIHIKEGAAEISLDVGPHFHHAAGSVHGSHYFKALDDAAFFAVNSLVDDVFVFTVSFNTFLVRPIVEGTMTSAGSVVNAGRSLWVAESTVKDDRGRVLGHGSGSFMKSRINLSDIPSYAHDG